MAKLKDWLANTMLIACWLAIGIATWWAFLDRSTVIEIQYQHPLFVSRIVDSRDKAKQFEVKQAKAGETVWRYLEWCLLKDYPGQIRLLWISDGFQYQVPLLPNAQKLGCHRRSIGVIVPPISGHSAELHVSTVFQRNPLATETVKLAPIPLEIK